jgi:hypothetical protein
VPRQNTGEAVSLDDALVTRVSVDDDPHAAELARELARDVAKVRHTAVSVSVDHLHAAGGEGSKHAQSKLIVEILQVLDTLAPASKRGSAEHRTSNHRPHGLDAPMQHERLWVTHIEAHGVVDDARVEACEAVGEGHGLDSFGHRPAADLKDAVDGCPNCRGESNRCAASSATSSKRNHCGALPAIAWGYASCVSSSAHRQPLDTSSRSQRFDERNRFGLQPSFRGKMSGAIGR